MAEGTLGSAAMLKRGDGVKGVAYPSYRVCRGVGGRAGYCTWASMPRHLHRKLWRCGGERVWKAVGEEEWAEVTGPLLGVPRSSRAGHPGVRPGVKCVCVCVCLRVLTLFAVCLRLPSRHLVLQIALPWFFWLHGPSTLMRATSRANGGGLRRPPDVGLCFDRFVGSYITLGVFHLAIMKFLLPPMQPGHCGLPVRAVISALTRVAHHAASTYAYPRARYAIRARPAYSTRRTGPDLYHLAFITAQAVC
eukprot:COSAG02_NODE_2206_length_9517_cov_3.928860_11_plen_249_part_00